jgi:hypothetical protein
MIPDQQTADAGQVLQFMTTEHFTLQTERASASSDANARVSLYMSALSASLISLALVAQLSELGTAFRGFALVLLPTVYVFGLVTHGRLAQAWVAWYGATQGMARIRHYYIEIAPEMAPYFLMPVYDDPRSTLAGSGIGSRRGFLQGLYTAPGAVGIVNSIVAAAFTGLVAHVLSEGSPFATGLVGGIGLVASLVGMVVVGGRGFMRRLASFEVQFPATETGPPPP